ncbi:MAG: type IV pilin N-terminal domain-containing protein [Methanoregulaceae archaeon]|jgi:hypothetical protein
MTREHAVSEVIGSILLISLVGIAVAIIAIMFLSQPVPVETQSLNVIAGNNLTHLFLYHDGGDAMVPGEFILQLDSTKYTQGAYTGWLAPGNAWPWEIGEILEIPLNQVGGIPERILIISTREGQETLIKQITIGQVVTPGPITPRPTPTPGPGDDCVVNFTERLQNGSVFFTRDRRGNQAYVSGYLNFTIDAPGSYIRIGATNTSLNPGDTLSIYVAPPNPNRNPEIRIFSVGTIGWTIRLEGTGSDVGLIRLNGGLIGNVISDSWITAFRDFESSFSLYIDGGTENTRLIINNTTKVNEPTGDSFRIVNIRPSEPTLFLLIYPAGSGTGTGGSPIFFIGHADEILRNNQPYNL